MPGPAFQHRPGVDAAEPRATLTRSPVRLLPHSHTLTLAPTRSLTHPLTHLLIHILPYLLTHAHIHLGTHTLGSLMHSLAHSTSIYCLATTSLALWTVGF